MVLNWELLAVIDDDINELCRDFKRLNNFLIECVRLLELSIQQQVIIHYVL